EAMNDLSEDVRRDFDTVFEAIGALSVKLPEAKKSRQPIGFKIREKE
ncbi:MAG: ORF6N domain-containing protein, partial [Alistipes sp.]